MWSTFGEAYLGKTYKNIQKYDQYPTFDQWRNNPLSDDSLIKPNIAGYQPYNMYKSSTELLKPTEDKSNNLLLMEQDYPITISRTTILPENPSYKKTKAFINTYP
jgi:hypothetical protein